MRVSDAAARGGVNERRTSRFAEALRTARVSTRAPARAADAAQRTPRAVLTRRTTANEKDGALRGRRDGFRVEERTAASPPIAAAVPGRPEPIPATPELRAAVRALPPVIEARGVAAGEPLALSLGGSLDVELRSVRGGVELVFRPDAGLARAARAELPLVVAALRARGVAVSRAEVKARVGAPVAQRGAR